CYGSCIPTMPVDAGTRSGSVRPVKPDHGSCGSPIRGTRSASSKRSRREVSFDPLSSFAHSENMPSLNFGPWRVHLLETGYLWLDGGSMFGSVPKPLWSKLQPPDERNRIRLAMRCLLLEGDEGRILVDDGIGTKFSPKLADIYGVEHDVHTLEGSLAAIGLGLADVTDVVLTHLHFDHAGGSTRLDGNRVVPTFPKARYHVQRRNLENARNPNPRERASYLAENFEPLEEHGAIDAMDGSNTPWPGFELFTANGHTRGQQLVRVSGPEGALYYVADLIPTA